MKPTLVKEKVTLEAIGKLIERSISVLPTRKEMDDKIAKLATKNEIAKLATKEEMNQAISRLATKEDISKIDDRLILMDKRFDAIDGKLLEFTEKFEKIDFKIERMDTRFTNQLDYFHLYYPTRNEFTDLGNRMKKVEKRLRLKV
jgi:ribosome assembly protein YihI (activator of Der GTPase)